MIEALLANGSTRTFIEKRCNTIRSSFSNRMKKNGIKMPETRILWRIRYLCWFRANYAERRRYGERVSPGFVESTVNTVVGKRFGKKQQMRWSIHGAHLMLQTRTCTLDGTLRAKFEQWDPGMNSSGNIRMAAQLPQTLRCSPNSTAPHFAALSKRGGYVTVLHGKP